ncbi:MAG: hypothetical protein WDN69_18040 [Aliidongia sp.]
MNRFCRADFIRMLRSAGWVGLAVLTVAASAPVDPGIAQFKPFVAKGIAESLAGAKAMRDRIAAHDLAGAQKAWLGARAGWEQAEVITDEFFPELDDAIDSCRTARPASTPSRPGCSAPIRPMRWPRPTIS